MVKPFMNIGPGDFISEEMEVRNWTNEDLSSVLGLSAKTISELLNNKQRITLDTARVLGKAFGQSPQYWLNLDNNYRLRMEDENDESEVEVKSRIYERMPINEMIKRGWIKRYKNIKELKQTFTDFWNISEFDYYYPDKVSIPNTRKSEAFSKFNKYFLLTWTQMAKRESEKFQAAHYNKKELQKLSKDLADRTLKQNSIPDFINQLEKCGVKFFCLSHLPKTYLDGASFLHQDNPVIVYTVRYDRLDNFWFTIAHEIGHILKHMKNKDDIFIDDLKAENNSDIEKEADDFASDTLKITEILDFFAGYKQYTSEIRVKEASSQLGIHTSVIIGALKHHKILTYNRLNHLNEPVKDKILKKYFV